ncbi:Paraneoplastic antigen-like protein 5 [Acipenser ruthenus]|uniref:Paraneoplastic antigen-like protein 5 n=1 Tax=Acipenser ruthenus TaxID=7906 RepID=A0A662YR95_ACIRT|nr:Paraneoplastic antigen-like protein 5 [Acipenser ruthenus]
MTVKKVLLQPDPQPPQPDFKRKFQAWLEVEGKTMEDVNKMIGSGACSSPSASEGLVNALGKALEKVMKPPQETSSYKHFRFFSGVKPMLIGEDDYDTWMDEAAHMIQESKWSLLLCFSF